MCNWNCKQTTYKPEVECYEACDSAIDKTVFIVTDLEKYTSYEDETSQMIYHRGGDPERAMHNVMAHKPWITCFMSVASKTLCSY